MKMQAIKQRLYASTFTLMGALSLNTLAGPLEETYLKVGRDGVATVRVPYLSSELATEDGRQQLHQRIARAAKDVCGPTSAHQAGGLRLASANRRCYEEAVEIAIGQIDNGQVAVVGH